MFLTDVPKCFIVLSPEGILLPSCCLKNRCLGRVTVQRLTGSPLRKKTRFLRQAKERERQRNGFLIEEENTEESWNVFLTGLLLPQREIDREREEERKKERKRTTTEKRIGSSVTRLGYFWKTHGNAFWYKRSKTLSNFTGIFATYYFLRKKYSAATFGPQWEKLGSFLFQHLVTMIGRSLCEARNGIDRWMGKKFFLMRFFPESKIHYFRQTRFYRMKWNAFLKARSDEERKSIG